MTGAPDGPEGWRPASLGKSSAREKLLSDPNNELWLLSLPRHDKIRATLVGREISLSDRAGVLRGNYVFSGRTPTADEMLPAVAFVAEGADGTPALRFTRPLSRVVNVEFQGPLESVAEVPPPRDYPLPPTGLQLQFPRAGSCIGNVAEESKKIARALRARIPESARVAETPYSIPLKENAKRKAELEAQEGAVKSAVKRSLKVPQSDVTNGQATGAVVNGFTPTPKRVSGLSTLKKTLFTAPLLAENSPDDAPCSTHAKTPKSKESSRDAGVMQSSGDGGELVGVAKTLHKHSLEEANLSDVDVGDTLVKTQTEDIIEPVSEQQSTPHESGKKVKKLKKPKSSSKKSKKNKHERMKSSSKKKNVTRESEMLASAPSPATADVKPDPSLDVGNTVGNTTGNQLNGETMEVNGGDNSEKKKKKRKKRKSEVAEVDVDGDNEKVSGSAKLKKRKRSDNDGARSSKKKKKSKREAEPVVS